MTMNELWAYTKRSFVRVAKLYLTMLGVSLLLLLALVMTESIYRYWASGATIPDNIQTLLIGILLGYALHAWMIPAFLEYCREETKDK